MEITLSLAQIIEIVILIVGLVGSYWYVRNQLNLLQSEKLSKDEFQKSMNGIRKDVSGGISEITDVYHELDKKSNEHEFRLKHLEDKNGIGG